MGEFSFNPLSANFSKWSNTLKQFVGKLQTNCLSVFGHFVGLALKGLIRKQEASHMLHPVTLDKGDYVLVKFLNFVPSAPLMAGEGIINPKLQCYYS